jgi:hypothetical protein
MFEQFKDEKQIKKRKSKWTEYEIRHSEMAKCTRACVSVSVCVCCNIGLYIMVLCGVWCVVCRSTSISFNSVRLFHPVQIASFSLFHAKIE